MSLRKFLAPLPANYDLPQMRALTLNRYASAVDVNVVDNGDGTQSLAVYFNGFAPTAASLTAWSADVAAAAVVHPTLDEQTVTFTANAAVIQQRLQQALTANAAFLASAKPGTAAAQASIAYDQTVRLTKECNALIRLALGQLDTITDTA